MLWPDERYWFNAKIASCEAGEDSPDFPIYRSRLQHNEAERINGLKLGKNEQPMGLWVMC